MAWVPGNAVSTANQGGTFGPTPMFAVSSLGRIWRFYGNGPTGRLYVHNGTSWAQAHDFGAPPGGYANWAYYNTTLYIDQDNVLHMLIGIQDNTLGSRTKYYTAQLNAAQTGFDSGPTYRSLSSELVARTTPVGALFEFSGDTYIVMFQPNYLAYIKWTGGAVSGTLSSDWTALATPPSSGYPGAIAFRHSGDRVTAQTQPDFAIVWGTHAWSDSNSAIRFQKYTWNGSGWTQGTFRGIKANVLRTESASCSTGLEYDAINNQWWIFYTHDRGTAQSLEVATRDLADTTTTERVGINGYWYNQTSPYNNAGAMGAIVGSDVYAFMGSESAGETGYGWTKWLGGTSWSAWTKATGTIHGSPHLCSRRPSQSVVDVFWYNAAFSAITYWGQATLNEPPTAPTINAPTDGSVADVAASLLIDWTFNDPDSGDSQSAYTVRRRLGAGSYEYWNGSAWQASEDASTKIASSSTQHSFSASWGLDSDADHYYSAKTWDAADAGPSPWSTEIRVVPSAKDNPTITSPGVDDPVGATETVSWTVASQTKYRVRVLGDTAGSPNTEIVEYDSGWLVDAGSRSATAVFNTNSVTRHIEVTTSNDEGLDSDPAYVRVQVSYQPPFTPTAILDTATTYGALLITVTNPPGGEPVAYNEIWRQRVGSNEWKRLATNIEENGSWTDWSAGSGVVYSYKVRTYGTNGAWVESS